VKAGQHAQHDATILAHLSTVDSVARRLAGGRYDFDDLRSVAYLALVRAVSDYRPDRGVALGAYLHLHIRWAILKGLRSDRRLRRADLLSALGGLDESSSFSGGSTTRWGHGEDELLRREEAELSKRRAAELLGALTPTEREVVVEHHVRGRELKELVRDGGPSYATVRRRAKSAMEHLRARAAVS
jgi:RNA polymerase sigma factor (sigma-70 family)